jgi:hypothetical protein
MMQESRWDIMKESERNETGSGQLECDLDRGREGKWNGFIGYGATGSVKQHA